MKVKTVNVVTLKDEVVCEIYAFSDDKEGNKEAEAKFTELGKEIGLKDCDVDAACEDGYFQNLSSKIWPFNQLTITHSEGV